MTQKELSVKIKALLDQFSEENECIILDLKVEPKYAFQGSNEPLITSYQLSINSIPSK